MNLIHAVLLGAVEGISEFLPISSTAHLILTSALFALPQTEFQKSFEIVIQLGAILAVVVLYARYILTRRDVWPKILVAFLPTAAIGFVVHSFAKRYLLGNVPLVLWTLLLGGIALVVFEWFHREKPDAADDPAKISYSQAALIGVFQSVAIIPGVSRSAATIVGGLLLGIRRKTIVDFTFLLAIPTMAAATVLDLAKSAWSFTPQEFALLGTGTAASFVVALLSIVWLLRYIQRHSFMAFGVYRIIVVLVVWMYILVA
ncbi:MAG: undecaprenyl-diphosphatase UppP [Candidatus Peribacteraceae bacterium]